MCNLPSSVEKINCIVLLGPTAVGKTALGVSLARHFDWDIISADSRQVYRGLDIGSGKDLSEYTTGGKAVKAHLIDVVSLAEEYTVFRFQKDFYALFDSFLPLNKMPFVVGGTGLYIDSIVRSYQMVDVPEDKDFHASLEKKSLEELDTMLLQLRPKLHNKSDLLIKERVIRAIEIETFMQSPKGQQEKQKSLERTKINALVLGTTVPREKLHQNIQRRLKTRLNEGMIEEVESLHSSGASWERLERLGLEYRFISEYLEGKIESKEEMEEKLYHAICQFAKRQETWFRGMQKKGIKIHWLNQHGDAIAKYDEALSLIERNLNC